MSENLWWIQKNAALLLSQGKKYPFKLGILWDLSLNTIPNSHSEPRGVSVYSGVIIICSHFLRDLESRLRQTASCTIDQISTLSYQAFSIRNILHSFYLFVSYFEKLPTWSWRDSKSLAGGYLHTAWVLISHKLRCCCPLPHWGCWGTTDSLNRF